MSCQDSWQGWTGESPGEPGEHRGKAEGQRLLQAWELVHCVTTHLDCPGQPPRRPTILGEMLAASPITLKAPQFGGGLPVDSSFYPERVGNPESWNRATGTHFHPPWLSGCSVGKRLARSPSRSREVTSESSAKLRWFPLSLSPLSSHVVGRVTSQHTAGLFQGLM